MPAPGMGKQSWPPPLSSTPSHPNMQRAHLPTPSQSPSTEQLSIEPINGSLTLIGNLTAFYQQERYSHLPTPPQSPSTEQLSIEPINSSLTLLGNLTAFYQQERYRTHHTRAALESAISSTVKGTTTLSTDVDDVESTLSSSPRSMACTLSSTAGLSDDSDYPSIKVEPLNPKMKSMDLQQRRRNRKNNNLRLKLSNIASPILKQQGTRHSQRILGMFAELLESRAESCERVTKMVQRYHRDRNLQMRQVVGEYLTSHICDVEIQLLIHQIDRLSMTIRQFRSFVPAVS